MKVSIAVNQKVGMPNYGSAGASCEITLDLAEHTVSEHPEALVTEIRRAYALAQDAVAEQLARQTAAAPEPAQKHEPEPPRREPDYDRRPSQGRQPSEREPDRPPVNGRYNPTHGPDGAARWQQNGAPKSGRELMAWSRKREESGENPGLFKRLEAYGRAVGYPGLMREWDRDMVNAAVSVVLGQAEPATAGRNGYHNGNGNGNGNGYY